jgi:hypothetical protein
VQYFFNCLFLIIYFQLFFNAALCILCGNRLGVKLFPSFHRCLDQETWRCTSTPLTSKGLVLNSLNMGLLLTFASSASVAQVPEWCLGTPKSTHERVIMDWHCKEQQFCRLQAWDR